MEDPHYIRGEHAWKQKKQTVHQWNAKKMEGNKYSSAAFLGVLTRELETHLYKKQLQLILVQLLQKACLILSIVMP